MRGLQLAGLGALRAEITGGALVRGDAADAGLGGRVAVRLRRVRRVGADVVAAAEAGGENTRVLVAALLHGVTTIDGGPALGADVRRDAERDAGRPVAILVHRAARGGWLHLAAAGLAGAPDGAV